jgi:hypothetical protein
MGASQVIVKKPLIIALPESPRKNKSKREAPRRTQKPEGARAPPRGFASSLFLPGKAHAALW